MALSIFNGSRLDFRTFRPKLGMSHPPLSHDSVLQSGFEYGMRVFGGIRVLNIHLYDQRFKRYTADPPLGLFDLKHALAVMASTLRKFSLTISTPGEDSWQFTRCARVSHRGKFDRFNFGDIFSGIEFKSLEDVYLRNVEFHPRHVGGFLQKYASTLQRVHMVQWHCELYLPGYSDLRLLRDIAGPALSLLTLESSENENMELCRFMISCDMTKKFYWCLNAVKLTELMLDWGLSHDQMCFAVCHTVKLVFNPHHDVPYASKIAGVVSRHTQRKLLEQPAYRTAMLNTSAEILAERAVKMEAQLLAYFQATDSRSVINGQLMQPLWFLYICLDKDLFVVEVNGILGLYLYTGESFFHFDRDFYGERMRYWKKDPESEFLTGMVADQLKEVEHSLDAFNHFERKGPDAPNAWKLPFAVEIPNLDATYERIRKKETWDQREATRKVSKKSKKHWAWIALRKKE